LKKVSAEVTPCEDGQPSEKGWIPPKSLAKT